MAKEPLKALVGAIQKFSTEDGPGIRTTIFLKGCPLNCGWCHNPELIDFEQQLVQLPNNCIGCGFCMEACPQKALFASEEGKVSVKRQRCDRCMKCVDICYARALQPVAKWMTVEEILYEASQDKGFYDHTEGGITISGGELLSHSVFVEELLDAAARQGINACLDTSGYGDGDALERLALKSNVTNILYDMKSIDCKIHITCVGVDNDIILENLKRLAANPKIRPKMILRMPLIRGINDSKEMIRQTAEFYVANGLKKVTLLPYHDLGRSKERNLGGMQNKFEAPTDERMREIENYLHETANMDVEILGQL